MGNPLAVPQSAKQAQEQLQTLRLPVPDIHTLSRISRDEGDQFKNAIADAGLAESPTQQASRQYLANVMTAYSPSVMETFRKLGYELPDPQQFMTLLKQEGRAIRAAVIAAASNPENINAKQYLQSVANQLALSPIQGDAPVTGAPTTSIPSAAPQDVSNSMPADAGMEDYCGPEGNDPSVHGQTGRTPIESAHLYGRQGAFCFTKDRTQTGSHPTITIDAARCFPNKEKSYDWKNKIAFQLTVGELPLIFGVFYGFLNDVKLLGHGKANNKSFGIANQDKNYYLTMQMGKDSSVAIPAIAKDTFKIMGFLLEQMKANFPNLDGHEVIAMTRRVCDIYLRHNSNKQAA